MKVNILNNHEVVLVYVDKLTMPYYHVETKPNGETCIRHSYGTAQHEIPAGFSILGPGTASQCSEEDAKGIVEWFELAGDLGYKDYQSHHLSYRFKNPVESLHSYIRANGKEPETCVIVYRKKN